MRFLGRVLLRRFDAVIEWGMRRERNGWLLFGGWCVVVSALYASYRSCS